jgi:hypothetical protein
MQLSRAERRLAAMLFDQIVPEGASGRLGLSASQAGVIDFFEKHLDHLPLRTRWALRSAVLLLGTAALVGGAQRTIELLASSHNYALRESITLLKSIVALGYCSNPLVRLEMGLDLPPVAS